MKPYEQQLVELNAQVWDYAELKFEESRSAEAIAGLLEQEGFAVQKGVGGLETAFTAAFGSGDPKIGILGEYDALSGLSQQADIAERRERENTACGHGCGHNLLGTAATAAALWIKDYLQASGKPGTVVMIGCPAEEGGSGKAYMARAGVFDGLDAALTWHPAGGNIVMTGSLQANCQAYFRFKGVSSHAAAAPHLGRSALDAVELMNVGVNYMREHMEPTDRIHYAVTDTGGTSPNVVQGKAEVLYLIRSINTEKVKRLYDRVCKIARGAALMTETEVEIVFDKACSNILPNSALEQVLFDSMTEIGVPAYTEEERAYARQFCETVSETEIMGDLAISFLPPDRKAPVAQEFLNREIADFIIPHQHADLNIPGSSDVGDVSHAVPTAQFAAACFVPGTPAHSWQMVAQGKSGIAVKGMLFAGEVLCAAAKRLYENPALLEQSKAEFKQRTGGKPYECPIPDGILPNMNAKKK